MIDPNLPINKTAALVVSSNADQQVSSKYSDYITSMVPLPTRKYTGNSEDLTGRKFGRLQVVGFSLWRSKGENPNRWVMRCQCGRYFIWKTKTVKKAVLDRCHECELTEYLATGTNSRRLKGE